MQPAKKLDQPPEKLVVCACLAPSVHGSYALTIAEIPADVVERHRVTQYPAELKSIQIARAVRALTEHDGWDKR